MTVTEYLDFELEIGLGLGRDYPLAVLRSPGGEARERMLFPFDELALASRLKDLQIALLRSSGGHRQILNPQERTVQEFGQKLFDALLSGEIRSRYDVSMREAAQKGRGLRLKLRIQPPELASLPWEFLYDPRRAEYICLSSQTPLVRYIELPQVIQPLHTIPPLRILGLIASPLGLAELDTEKEKQRIETALADLTATGQVQIDWLEHANRRNLQRNMRRGHWHILHFIGHGGFDPARDEGFIALETERNELDRLSATHLARLIADHRSLRLAVLNSCEGAQGGNTDIFSSTASLLIRRGLPAVLAMQYEITDRAAIEFARGFYEALTDGLPVDTATTEARKAVSLGLTDTIEWGTPVLYMHTPDGILFELPKPIKSAHPMANSRAGDRQTEHDTFKMPDDENKIYDWIKKESNESAEQKTAEHKTPEKYEPLLSLNLGNGVTIEFLRVPKGDFWMGSEKRLDKRARNDELPQHKVYLDEFLMGKAPVTNQQYRAFVQATGYHAPEHWEKGNYYPGQEYHPVVNVCWEDALTFCRWASSVTGQQIRLPSEAEWEKAARGKDQRLYPWGNQSPTARLCNHGQSFSGDPKTTPVGLYSPQGDSPYGCMDMAGNVWEWVADWYLDNYYRQSPQFNPPGPLDGTVRVLRGGSWLGARFNSLRISFRRWGTPDSKENDCGFRCAI